MTPFVRPNNDPFDALILAIMTRLNAAVDVVAGKLAVLDEDDPNLPNACEIALNGRGAYMLVMNPELVTREPIIEATVTIRVLEFMGQNRSLGGTGRSANAWARIAWARLIELRWMPAAMWTPLRQPSLKFSGEERFEKGIVLEWTFSANTRCGQV